MNVFSILLDHRKITRTIFTLPARSYIRVTGKNAMIT